MVSGSPRPHASRPKRHQHCVVWRGSGHSAWRVCAHCLHVLSTHNEPDSAVLARAIASSLAGHAQHCRLPVRAHSVSA